MLAEFLLSVRDRTYFHANNTPMTRLYSANKC